MHQKYYDITFEESGSTAIRARTPRDAVSYGRHFRESGRTNVRIATRDDQSFTVDEFHAALVAAGKAV